MQPNWPGEILWSRVLEHLVAGLALSFAVLLAVYLLALAIGARIAASLADRARHPLAWGSALVAGSATFAFLPMTLLGRWNAFVQPLSPVSPALARPSALRWWTLSLVHSVYLEGASCLLMGAAFPLLIAAVVRQRGAGRSVGTLYAANTLAGVVGSFVTGFVLLPALGVERSLGALALASALASALVALLARLGPRGLALPTVATLAIGVTLLTLAPDHFRSVYLRATPLFVREGTTTSVAVLQRTTFDQPTWRELATPGVSMSDTRFVSRRYMSPA